MKRSLRLSAILLIVTLTLPMFSFAGPTGVAQNPDVLMPKASPVIDGTIEDTGIWSEAAYHNDDTVGYYWASRPLTHEAKMYFAYDENNFYFAADITDNDEASGLVYSKSASYDPEYGYTGDVMTLMLDPLGLYEKSAYQDTPRYNIGIFSNGGIGVFRTMDNPSPITTQLEAKGAVTDNGWRFEIAFPWSLILKDMNSITTYGLNTSLASLYAKNAVSKASCIYMDRYWKDSSTIDTWGRFITVCEKTFDGKSGISTNGTDAKSFGIVLVNGNAPDHLFGEWTVLEEASCTKEGLREHTCIDCGEVVCEAIPMTEHTFGKWTVVIEATNGISGSKMRSCTVCQKTEYKTIPPHGDSLLVAYYNASVAPAAYEFTNIDVLNFHPATIVAAANSNPASGSIISHNFTSTLAATREKAQAQNPDVKFLFTVASNNLTTFESWFASKTYALKLANEITSIIKTNGFDGFDIDYEFPSGSSTYKTNFVYFMKCLRENLDALSASDGKEYFLSMAVPGTSWAFSLFDMTSLAEHVDYFNIMNYDLFINSSYTHHHTPPYDNSPSGLTGGSVNSDIKLYLNKGITADKIVPGCGMYSLRWKNVTSSTNNGLYQSGTRDTTNIHYTEIKNSYVNKNGYVRYWDSSAQAPYLYNKSEGMFISYDDEQSVEIKCKLVAEQGIRGIMVFDYCTVDGIGFFDNMRSWLDKYTLHPCKDGHSYGDWFVYREPTYVLEGEMRSQCKRCDAYYSKPIAKLEGSVTAPTITQNNNLISITEAANIEKILYATGNYSTVDELVSAGASEISSDTVKSKSENNTYTFNITDDGEYTLCVVMIDTNAYFKKMTITGNQTKISVDGVAITVSNLNDVKDIFIALGVYNNYTDVNKNKTARITSTKIGNANKYSYSVNAGGEYTVLIRHNDSSMEFLYVKVNVTEPTFSLDGLQLTIGNLEGIKVIRTAAGAHTSAASIKKTAGSRAFTARYIPNKDAYMIQYRQNGLVTVAVCYENGYSVFYKCEIVQKVPTFTQDGNMITIGDVDDLKVVRYAKGEYETSSQIKKAAGSVAMTSAHIINGVIKVRLGSAGTYTFCVQFNDESYNYYKVIIE